MSVESVQVWRGSDESGRSGRSVRDVADVRAGGDVAPVAGRRRRAPRGPRAGRVRAVVAVDHDALRAVEVLAPARVGESWTQVGPGVFVTRYVTRRRPSRDNA